MKKNTFAIYTSVTACVLAAFTNSYLTTLKGGAVDAKRFLDAATDWAGSNQSFQFSINFEFFYQFLGIFVRLGADRFLLSLIGIFIFFTSIILSLKLFLANKKKISRMLTESHIENDLIGNFSGVILSPREYNVISMAIIYLVLLSPSVVLRVGNLQREPYIVAGLMLIGAGIITFSAQYFAHPNFPLNRQSLLIILGGSILATPFHKASLLFAFLAIFTLLLVLFRRRNDSSIFLNYKKLLFRIFAVLLALLLVSIPAYLVTSFLSKQSSASQLALILSSDVDTLSLQGVGKQEREDDARAQYQYPFDLTSPQAIATTVLFANIYYYLYPFKPSSASDLFICFENILRFYVIVVLLLSLRRPENLKSAYAKALFYLICFYLLSNSIFALGTANFGTGSRHHMTLFPLFLLALPILRSRNRNGTI